MKTPAKQGGYKPPPGWAMTGRVNMGSAYIPSGERAGHYKLSSTTYAPQGEALRSAMSKRRNRAMAKGGAVGGIYGGILGAAAGAGGGEGAGGAIGAGLGAVIGGALGYRAHKRAPAPSVTVMRAEQARKGKKK